MNKYEEFFSNTHICSVEENKELLIKSLDRLKSLDVTEFTFYKKWEEIREYTNKNKSSDIEATSRKIWLPSNMDDVNKTIQEIESLEPEVIYVNSDNESYYDDWINLRIFCHTMEFDQTPGRFLRFVIVDKPTKKYLGVLSISSDMPSTALRDKYIGWSNKNRMIDGMLRYSAVASCIMSTQPFGYNFLGGKLIACLATSKVVRDTWKSVYNETLAGITTTSLYGSYSMYNNLKWWHKCGSTKGEMLIKPDQSQYDIWHSWIKENMTAEYEKVMTQKENTNGPVTSAKTKVLSMIFKSCGIKMKDYHHGYERGLYYACLYENTKEFLQNKIKETELKIKPLIDGDVQNILDWWKPKAIERYKRLLSENKIKKEILFYLPMKDMKYEEAKTAYFKEVGR